MINAVLALALLGQKVSTTPSQFLVDGDSVYEPTPVYAAKAASSYERMTWSNDGTRLAIVSTLPGELPRESQARIAKGINDDSTMHVGIWRTDTGQYKEIATTKKAIGDFEFVGKDLLCVIEQQICYFPDGGDMNVLEVPNEGVYRLLASRRRNEVLVVNDHGLWLMTRGSTKKLEVAGTKTYLGRGVTAKDEAFFYADQKMMLYDFATGHLEQTETQPVKGGTMHFILDCFRLTTGARAPIMSDGAEFDDAKNLDGKPLYVDSEDGGYKVELVDKSDKHRRIAFIPECAQWISVSSNGLSYAYLSHRTVMVRLLVKLDAAAAKKRLETGR